MFRKFCHLVLTLLALSNPLFAQTTKAMIEKGEWSSDGKPVGQPPATPADAPAETIGNALPLPDNKLPAPGVPSDALPRPDIAAVPPKPAPPPVAKVEPKKTPNDKLNKQ